MSKFKVGDEVVVIETGKIGVIEARRRKLNKVSGHTKLYYDGELELIRPATLTITEVK